MYGEDTRMRSCGGKEGHVSKGRYSGGITKAHFEEGLVVAYPLQRRGAKI